MHLPLEQELGVWPNSEPAMQYSERVAPEYFHIYNLLLLIKY